MYIKSRIPNINEDIVDYLRYTVPPSV